MEKANLFILGAAKSGTTSLANYLDEHPEIFISKPKEPNFFATDLSEKYPRIQSREAYDLLFKDAPSKTKIFGDASTMYLPSPYAVDSINRYNPNAKFLIIIRNPILMSESWHSHKSYYREEEIENFEEAWNLQEQRRNGDKIPKRCLDSTHLQYLQFCSIGTQIEKVLEKVSNDRLMIVFLEDLKANPKNVYEKIINFLNVSQYKKEHFETFNQYKKVSYNWIHKIITSFSYGTIKKIKSFKKSIGIESFSLVKFIEKKNRKHPERELLSIAFKAVLVNAFRGEIEKIERITNRDLSEWKKI